MNGIQQRTWKATTSFFISRCEENCVERERARKSRVEKKKWGRKLGGRRDKWRKGTVEVSRYSVQHATSVSLNIRGYTRRLYAVWRHTAWVGSRQHSSADRSVPYFFHFCFSFSSCTSGRGLSPAPLLQWGPSWFRAIQTSAPLSHHDITFRQVRPVGRPLGATNLNSV